jgi:hypothetical protein
MSTGNGDRTWSTFCLARRSHRMAGTHRGRTPGVLDAALWAVP